MQQSLQELHEFIKEWFPKLQDKVIYKIIFSIKERLTKFKYVGLSRYEDFWISERRLRQVIDYLRNYWILVYHHTTLSKKKERLCNAYTIWEWFIEMFKSLERFTKNPFVYFNPLDILKHFQYKEKRYGLIFKVRWVKYIIPKLGKFAWKIYSTGTNTIVNPYELIT